MQVFPDAWTPRVQSLMSRYPRMKLHTRVNFRFDAELYRSRRAASTAPTPEAVRVDESVFARFGGSVVPLQFWDGAEKFVREGLGVTVMKDGEPASVAFSSWILGNELELGIETVERYRGQGLAWAACVVLIEECLARGLTPVWSCRLGNVPSHRLAESLGFKSVCHLPYFELPPRGADDA